MQGEEGLSQERFYSYFSNFNCEYLGEAFRVMRPSKKDVKNSSFEIFCLKRGYKVPDKYRMAKPNLHTGYMSFSKYDKTEPVVDAEAWVLAKDWMERHFRPFMSQSKVISQEKALEIMDKTSSCGFPWNLKYHDKNDFLKDEVVKEVLPIFWDKIALEECDIIPIWSCTQKVEVRPVEKLDEGKIRTFTASPIEMSVAMNRLFVDQNEGFYSGANESWSCVGMTKFLGGWDRLQHRLNLHSFAYELDAKDYDASLFCKVLETIRDFRIKMWDDKSRTPANFNRARFLYEQVIHSTIVLEDGTLMRKHGGNPSGSSNTVVDNTLALFLFLAYAWVKLCPEEMCNYASFMKHVIAALYGDDNDYTCSQQANEWFCAAKVAAELTKIGITTKTPTEKPRNIEECQFLSSGFGWSEKHKMWWPVSDLDKVLGSLYCGSNVDDVRWHYLRACALRIDSYGNSIARNIIQEYIDFLDKEYRPSLIGEIKGIPMQDILHMWKSDAWIEGLYIGYEAVRPVNTEYCFKNIPSLLEHITQLYQSNQISFCESAMPKANKKIKKIVKNVEKKLFKRKRNVKSKPRPNKRFASGAIRQLAGHALPMVGSMFGPVGAAVGGLLGKVVGNGDYTVAGSNAVSSGEVGPPQFGNSSGGVRIKHREFITDVLGTVNFTSIRYNNNPGLTQHYPFLGPIAAMFEEYKEHGVVYEFRSTSSVSLSTTQQNMGTVILASQYDPYDPAFTSKLQMENYDGAVSARPSQNIMHGIELKKRITPVNQLYVRTGAFSGDQRLYDFSTFNIATVGMQNDGDIVGELWVTYDIELFKPKIGPSPSETLNYFSHSWTATDLRNSSLSRSSATMSSSNGMHTGNTSAPVPGTTESGLMHTKMTTRFASTGGENYIDVFNCKPGFWLYRLFVRPSVSPSAQARTGSGILATQGCTLLTNAFPTIPTLSNSATYELSNAGSACGYVVESFVFIDPKKNQPGDGNASDSVSPKWSFVWAMAGAGAIPGTVLFQAIEMPSVFNSYDTFQDPVVDLRKQVEALTLLVKGSNTPFCEVEELQEEKIQYGDDELIRMSESTILARALAKLR